MLDPEKFVKTLSIAGFDIEDPEQAKVVEAARAIAATLASYGLSEPVEEALLDLLSAEARKAVNQHAERGEDVWEDFNYGNVGVGHVVRVKKDAYDSETGTAHNGRVGTIASMRSRRCRVKYLGLNADSSIEHPITKLDSLKLGVE